MSAVRSDVLVVGGGVVGTSAAFFLSQRGRRVSLVERHLIGQQASGTNFGNLRRQGRALEQLPLANRATEIWHSSKALLGEDIEYMPSGHIRICYKTRPNAVENFEDYAREAKLRGLNLEVLTGSALRKRFPFFGDEVLVGSYSAADGHANPRLVSPAFADAARKLGASIHEHTHIVHVEKDGEDFTAVSEDGRTFRAPTLLIAAGAWGDRLSEQFNEVLPLTSKAPTLSVTEPAPYSVIPSVGVFTPDKIEDVYFRQTPRGNIIIGGSSRGEAFPEIGRSYVNPQNTLNQLEQIQRLAPKLGRLNIIRVWTGIEGYFPDFQPVISASSQQSGLFYAFGFSGSGFQIGPGVGSTMAELIDSGKTDIDLTPFSVSRWQENS